MFDLLPNNCSFHHAQNPLGTVQQAVVEGGGGAGWLAEAPFRQVSPPASASPPHRWTAGGYSPALPSSFSKWLSSPASQIARRLIPLSVTAMYRYTRKPELYLEEKHPVTSENSLPSSPFFCIDRFSCNQPVWTGLVLANPLRATGIVGYCFMAPFSQSASYSSGLPTGCSTCFGGLPPSRHSMGSRSRLPGCPKLLFLDVMNKTPPPPPHPHPER